MTQSTKCNSEEDFKYTKTSANPPTYRSFSFTQNTGLKVPTDTLYCSISMYINQIKIYFISIYTIFNIDVIYMII